MNQSIANLMTGVGNTMGEISTKTENASKGQGYQDIVKSIGGKSISIADRNANRNAGESDQRLKNILGEDAPVDEFARINAYLYKYKPEARAAYGGEKGVDDRVHVGVMAQELAENPVTESTVSEDENGFLQVDTRQLCLTLAAVVSDLSRRVLELEEQAETKQEARKEDGESGEKER